MNRRRHAALGSVLFFIAAPGTIAGLVPYWLTDGWQGSAPLWSRVPGALLILGGLAVLVHAFGRFVMEGIGTPAPIAPPRHLVVGGLYRHVRNPMYVALLAIILGQAMWFGNLGLALYGAITWAGTALFVSIYEEPTLARTFGQEYDIYRRHVRAWWPRLTPWRPLQ